MDSKELKLRLLEYESLIRRVIGTFVHSFGQANPGPLWRQGKIERVGTAGPNGEVEYSLHGRGCSAELDDKHISFDYDHDSNFVYTPFKFMMLLPEDAIEHDDLERLFLELRDEGELECIEGRGVRLKTCCPS